MTCAITRALELLTVKKAILFVAAYWSLLGIGQKAEALPFGDNCSSMQQYFRAALSRNSAGDKFSYQGFEGQQITLSKQLATRGLSANPQSAQSRDYHTAVCSGGYITIQSPQGTKVCTGTLSYGDPEIYNLKEWETPMFLGLGAGVRISYDSCRWR